MMTRTKPQRLRDLPGWEESFQEALKAKRILEHPGTSYRYAGSVSLRTAGNFVPPDSITHVTVPLLLCLAIGIESQRSNDRFEREKSNEREKRGNVVDIREARFIRALGGPEGLARREGYDIRDASTWTPDLAPLFVDKVCEVIDDLHGKAQ